jgi:CheY-like chemotaxis protein
MHLTSSIDTRPLVKPPQPPEPPLPTTKSINASSKSALLVEDDKSLLNFLKRSLKDEGYVVRTASNTEEGFRLYRECAPFSVVLIDYCVPKSDGVGVDYCAPQTNGIELAMAIREINPSQGIIIAAFDYRNAGEVPRPQELMHIPLLTDPRNSQLPSLLEKIEVDRAIEALTSSELLKLQKFAAFRVRGLGRAARGRTWEDLLEETLLRTLMGALIEAEGARKGRHWNKSVDFVQHLKRAMESISSCWKRKFKEKEVYLMSELLIDDAEGQEHSPLDNAASGHAAADQRLIEKDEEDRVLAMFKGDPEATQVLLGLLHGLKKNEIGLDKKKYAATEKRIRVKLLGRRNGGEQG